MYDFLCLAEHALVRKMKLFTYLFEASPLFADCDYKVYYIVPVTAFQHFSEQILARRGAGCPKVFFNVHRADKRNYFVFFKHLFKRDFFAVNR